MDKGGCDPREGKKRLDVSCVKESGTEYGVQRQKKRVKVCVLAFVTENKTELGMRTARLWRFCVYARV